MTNHPFWSIVNDFDSETSIRFWVSDQYQKPGEIAVSLGIKKFSDPDWNNNFKTEPSLSLGKLIDDTLKYFMGVKITPETLWAAQQNVAFSLQNKINQGDICLSNYLKEP